MMKQGTAQQAAESTVAAVQEVAKTTTQTVQVVSETTAKAVDSADITLSEFSMDKMQSFFDAAEKVIQMYGGEAVDLGLNVLRIDAFTNMYAGLLMLIIFTFTAKSVFAWYKTWLEDTYKIIRYRTFELESEERVKYSRMNDFWDTSFRSFIGILGIGSYGIVFLVTTLNLNLWAWVGVIYPELYAVHKLLMPAGG